MFLKVNTKNIFYASKSSTRAVWTLDLIYASVQLIRGILKSPPRVSTIISRNYTIAVFSLFIFMSGCIHNSVLTHWTAQK